MKYVYIITKTATGYSAHVPDLPGCIATGKTEAKTRRLIEEGVEFHLEGLRLEGFKIPKPTTLIGYAEVA